MTSSAIKPNTDLDTLVSNLPTDAVEDALNEFELALIRAHNGLERWQQQSMLSVSETPLSGAEGALLHIIRMNDRPKSIKELARLTNRDDIPNIQYSLRKLASAGLINKSGSGRTGVTYSTTADGVKLTDAHLANRREQLIETLKQFEEIENEMDVTRGLLNRVTGIFEETVRNIAARR